MIELEGVTKKYGNLTALREVSFEIRKNEYPVNPASYLPEH